MKTDNPCILIVEDSETQAVLLSATLESHGWQTHWCDTAERALKTLSEKSYQLIIVDFHLPGMNGDQFCRNVKMNIHTRSIPVLMFTVEGSTESQNKALESGADFFVSKEIDTDILVAKIQSLVEQAKDTQFITKDFSSFRQSQILAIDDSPTYLAFLEESFKADGILLDTASNGKEALKMIQEKNYDCILLDLVMPDMDGIAVCRQITRHKSLDKGLMVIMMLTAHENKKEMMCALEAGADDFVGKSNDISIVKARMAALLRRRYIQLDNQKIWQQLKEKELKAERARIEKEAAQAKALISDKLQETVKQLENEINEKEIIAEELRKAKETADEASKAKSEFLSNMSHELRSPLNSMLILSQLLAENKTGNLTDEQVEIAQIVNSSGKDLLTMINDLLDLSKVEAAKMELQLGTFNLETFLEDIGRKFRVQAQEKELQFVTHISPDLPSEITTDPQRLSQIIRNLLSNAFKFTLKGEVRLEAALPKPGMDFSRSRLAPNETFMLSVSDTGIGIPESKKKLIFQSFTQADGSTSRKFGGTGLGLTISETFSRFLGGEIQLESQEGKGSTFSIFLPTHLEKKDTGSIKTASANKPPAVQPASFDRPREKPDSTRPDIAPEPDRGKTPSDVPDKVLDGLKILLVDDDMRNVFTFMHLFRTYNMTVIVGENGKKGLEKLKEHPDVSLIIMDMMMPVMDGYEAMAAIRAQEAYRQLPIIAVTAKAMKGDREKCLDAGATEYMAKPVDNDLLMALIRRLI